MNKPIRTLSLFALLLFLLLLVNVTYVQYVRAGDLNADARNRRVIDAAFSRDRGPILVGNVPVAESVPSDDRFEHQRVYPQPYRYAAVTGFFSFFTQTGIEASQNAVLSGDDPRLFVTRLLDLVNNSSPQGGRVRLTLDADAQVAAFDGLSALGEDVQGSVVALEPDTGKVLAMVSLPTFDPNKLATHDLEAEVDNYEQLEDDPAQPLLNRAIQTRLPPGSTFKIVTAAAALENDLVDDADSQVPGGPSYQLPQSTAVIDNGGRDCGTDTITLTQALANSCNTTFLQLADQLGLEKMLEQSELFGFNSEYLDDLAGQVESVYPDEMNRPQVALSGIGQYDVSATPLQMAMVVGGVANGGTVMKPYLVEEVLSPDLDVIDRPEPTELSRAVSPSTASELTKALVTTVASGTATPAQIPGVQVAGKTGTAENCDGCRPYAWFVSFAPADDPEVAVAVMIQGSDVPADDIAGGRLGGPIAKSVMEAVLGP